MSTTSKKESALVSIIVPVFNAESFIEDTIKTVLNQTYSNWELILVDDCSPDGSIKIIKEYAKNDPRICLFMMAKNSGAALTRNKGIAEAKGRFIAFLDADDLWTNNKIELQLNYMQENNYSFSFTSYEFADQEGRSTHKAVNVPPSMSYAQALKNPIIWTSTVMLDTSTIPKGHIYMPDIRRGQDAATWWRILRKTTDAYGMNIVTAYYRRTSDSLSANKFKAIKRTWYLYREVEQLNIVFSAYNFMYYAYNAVKKRT